MQLLPFVVYEIRDYFKCQTKVTVKDFFLKNEE